MVIDHATFDPTINHHLAEDNDTLQANLNDPSREKHIGALKILLEIS